MIPESSTCALSRDLSYRIYEEFSVVVQSRRGLLLKLNRSAGRRIEEIDEGRAAASALEDSLLRDFLRLGLLEGVGPRAGSIPEPTPRPDHREGSSSDLLENLNRLASRRLIPLHAHVELTHRCALTCRHCYLEGGRLPAGTELSCAEIETLLDGLKRLGTLFLSLSGGDPFQREDLEEIVRAARRRRFAVSLLTSGFGVEEEALVRLSDLGLDGLQVSLHAAEAGRHDAFAGRKGAFEGAWKVLQTGRRLGIPVRAAVSLRRGNLDDLPRIVSSLRERQIPWSPVINLFPRRIDGRPREEDQIGEEELQSIRPLLPRRDRFRLGHLGLDDPPCRAGFSVLSVGPSGELFPCPAWPERAGSIREKNVEEIWRNSAFLKRVRRLTLGDLIECSGCERRDTCNRCTGLAVQEGRTSRGHSPLDCVQARMYDASRE